MFSLCLGPPVKESVLHKSLKFLKSLFRKKRKYAFSNILTSIYDVDDN